MGGGGVSEGCFSPACAPPATRAARQRRQSGTECSGAACRGPAPPRDCEKWHKCRSQPRTRVARRRRAGRRSDTTPAEAAERRGSCPTASREREVHTPDGEMAAFPPSTARRRPTIPTRTLTIATCDEALTRKGGSNLPPAAGRLLPAPIAPPLHSQRRLCHGRMVMCPAG